MITTILSYYLQVLPTSNDTKQSKIYQQIANPLNPLNLPRKNFHNIYSMLSAMVGSLLKKLAAHEGNLFLNLGGLKKYKPQIATTHLIGTK